MLLLFLVWILDAFGLCVRTVLLNSTVYRIRNPIPTKMNRILSQQTTTQSKDPRSDEERSNKASFIMLFVIACMLMACDACEAQVLEVAHHVNHAQII